MENANGIKVYSRRGLTELLAHVAKNGIPQGADIPVEPLVGADKDEEDMDSDDLLPAEDQPEKELTPEQINTNLARAESLIAKLTAMKQKYYDNLGDGSNPVVT